MKLRSMPLEDIRRVLEPEENLLHPRLKVQMDRWRDCPACGSVFTPTVDGTKLRMRCVGCGCTLDPETGLITDLGKPEKTRDVEFRMISPPGGEQDDPAGTPRAG